MKKKIITIEEIEDFEKEYSNRADDGGTTFVIKKKESESGNARLMECQCKCSLTSSCGGGGGGGGSKITELESEV